MSLNLFKIPLHGLAGGNVCASVLHVNPGKEPVGNIWVAQALLGGLNILSVTFKTVGFVVYRLSLSALWLAAIQRLKWPSDAEIWLVRSLVVPTRRHQVKDRWLSAVHVFCCLFNSKNLELFAKRKDLKPRPPSALAIWLKQISSNWQSLGSVKQEATCCVSCENHSHLSGQWDNKQPVLSSSSSLRSDKLRGQ